MIGLVASLVTGGIDAYKQHGKNKAEQLKRKDEMEQEKHNAQVKRLQSGETRAANLDELSIKNRGWKDEFILLVVFIPLILSFIPDYAQYVKSGFEALKGIPDYYWYVVFAVVIDTLGMRAMVRYLLEFFSHKFKGT